jgi:hypothetical protein
LISSAVFGLVPVPLDAQTSSDEGEIRHVVDKHAQELQKECLSPENAERLATQAELGRLRAELGIS